MLIDDYLFFMREAFIVRMMETEEGQKYLENAWLLTQTEPDRNALREKFGRKELNNGE